MKPVAQWDSRDNQFLSDLPDQPRQAFQYNNFRGNRGEPDYHADTELPPWLVESIDHLHSAVRHRLGTGDVPSGKFALEEEVEARRKLYLRVHQQANITTPSDDLVADIAVRIPPAPLHAFGVSRRCFAGVGEVRIPSLKDLNTDDLLAMAAPVCASGSRRRIPSTCVSTGPTGKDGSPPTSPLTRPSDTIGNYIRSFLYLAASSCCALSLEESMPPHHDSRAPVSGLLCYRKSMCVST